MLSSAVRTKTQERVVVYELVGTVTSEWHIRPLWGCCAALCN